MIQKSYKYYPVHDGMVIAKDVKEGDKITNEGAVFEIKKIQISKIGKHGRSKCRLEVVNKETKEELILIKPSEQEFETVS